MTKRISVEEKILLHTVVNHRIDEYARKTRDDTEHKECRDKYSIGGEFVVVDHSVEDVSEDTTCNEAQ